MTITAERHPSWCEQELCSGLDHHADSIYVQTTTGDLGEPKRLEAVGVAPSGTDHGSLVVNLYLSDVPVDELGSADLITARLTPTSARLLAMNLANAADLAEGR